MSMRTRRQNKLRITQTLINSWQYSFKTDSGYEDFLRTLNREPKQPTKAMLDGIRFESVLNSVLDGEEIPPDHEWYKPIRQLAKYLKGSQKQVVLYQDTEVMGYPILLHGVLDYLRAGMIYDTKYSPPYGTSRQNNIVKYLNSPQHPLYLALVPEARAFEYLICDGEHVYRETYPRDIVDPIEPTIAQFIKFLQNNNLFEIYKEKWSVQN